MSQGGTNLPRVGGYNQAVVLDAIRTRGPVSRVELGPLTGLTNQTVSNVVRRLLAAGLVTESGHAPSSGGKRRTLLTPRAEGAYAAGVHIDPEVVRIVLVDLVGRVLVSTRIRPGAGDPADLVRRAALTVRRVTARAGVDPARLLGVGVATPGPIDRAEGLVVGPPNLPGWGRVPLSRLFAEATRTPVAMDNDATAAAIGERWIGGQDRAGSFLFVYVGTGVGAGIVLGGTVLHGDTGNAGEFGHMAVEAGALACYCGATNCLGPYCTPAALVGDLLDRHGRAAARAVGVSGEPDSVREDFRRLRLAAGRGDAACADTVRGAARRLGQAARGAVELLDVGTVVLGGEGLRDVEDLVVEEVARVVNARRAGRLTAAPRVRVERSLTGETVGAVGAASLVLHGNYAPGWGMLTEAGAVGE
ncbi:ROK family protein [Streptomyces sp. NPDC059740]|uniref:ROK family transcriptional regulator n=1 Tax=Streptomyces sp. NPDC059740 TaxID=3346926 RepID=UPI00366241C1